MPKKGLLSDLFEGQAIPLFLSHLEQDLRKNPRAMSCCSEIKRKKKRLLGPLNEGKRCIVFVLYSEAGLPCKSKGPFSPFRQGYWLLINFLARLNEGMRNSLLVIDLF